MKLKLICEQINNVESFIAQLKRSHPRSQAVPIFEKQTRALLSGEIDEIPRNKFSVSIGKQWGLEFIDKLVKEKIFDLKKVGNKIYIVNKMSKSNVDLKIKKLSNYDLSLILKGISLGAIEMGETNQKLHTMITNNGIIFKFIFADNDGKFYDSSEEKSKNMFIKFLNNIHPKVVDMFINKNSTYIKQAIFSINDHWNSKGASDLKNFFDIYYELKDLGVIDFDSFQFSELKVNLWEPYRGGSDWTRPFKAQVKCEISFSKK